jgi:hypothetical protein
MSTIETILTRAMNDPAFAEALFADPEKALAEYDLPPEVMAKFKEMSRADFKALSAEERQSMLTFFNGKWGDIVLKR